MGATYAAGDIVALVFDPASYFIRDVRGVEVTRDPYIVGSNYQVQPALRIARRRQVHEDQQRERHNQHRGFQSYLDYAANHTDTSA